MMIRDEKGYTLVELMTVIAIISISMGIATFSLSFVFNRNVDAKMTEVSTQIRSAKNLQVEKSADTYSVEFTVKDGNTILHKRVEKSGVVTELATVKVPNNLEFVKVVGGSEIKISDLLAHGRSDEIKFEFDSATGKLTTDGFGLYKIKYKDKEATMRVIKQNGKVILNE